MGSPLTSSSALRARRRRLPRPPQELDLHAAGAALPDAWFQRKGYQLIAARRWRWPREHINVKETRVAVMQLRHVCRVGRHMGKRLVTLTDSQVALGCLEKGRSSRSPALNALCRRAAAYQIACMISWRPRHWAPKEVMMINELRTILQLPRAVS